MSDIPRRPYGNTGVRLSVVGFGGIVVAETEQAHANRVVAEAVERGINYFDVAPSYGDAEERLGPALEPFRDEVFLACKTGKRDRAGAEAEFKESLKRLRTDQFDLYQLHAITDVAADVDAAFTKGGVMEMVAEAKRVGQIRFVGFSAHSVEAALTAMDRFDFDSILFPINFATFYKEDFGPVVLAKAHEKGVARLALKAMARQKWAEDDPRRAEFRRCWYEPITDLAEADLALRWSLSQSITAAIPPGEEALWRMAVNIAAHYTEPSAAEVETLRRMASDLEPVFAGA